MYGLRWVIGHGESAKNGLTGGSASHWADAENPAIIHAKRKRKRQSG